MKFSLGDHHFWGKNKCSVKINFYNQNFNSFFIEIFSRQIYIQILNDTLMIKTVTNSGRTIKNTYTLLQTAGRSMNSFPQTKIMNEKYIGYPILLTKIRMLLLSSKLGQVQIFLGKSLRTSEPDLAWIPGV